MITKLCVSLLVLLPYIVLLCSIIGKTPPYLLCTPGQYPHLFPYPLCAQIRAPAMRLAGVSSAADLITVVWHVLVVVAVLRTADTVK